MTRTLFLSACAALLAACGGTDTTAPESAAVQTAAPAASVDRTALDAALVAQPDDIRARYGDRHPGETLAFFGLEPGMTVVDALPGSKGEGWYTAILARYLGSGETPGKLVGMDYSIGMWPEFSFATDAFIEGKRSWSREWVAGSEARMAAGDFGDADVSFDASTFGGPNGTLAGQADAVLFMRALHNLARFEREGGYLSEALADAYALLEPGGIVGVVQHRAAEDMPDDWANGSNGYLKQSFVVSAFEDAGFVLVDSAEINANPADRPTVDDGVWRLPPSLSTSREDEALKAALQAVGESDRMTLLFRKPAES